MPNQLLQDHTNIIHKNYNNGSIPSFLEQEQLLHTGTYLSTQTISHQVKCTIRRNERDSAVILKAS